MKEKENMGPLSKKIQETKENSAKYLKDLQLSTEEDNLRKINEELTGASDEKIKELTREKRETTRRIINLKEETLKEWQKGVDTQIEDIRSEIDKLIPKIRLYEVELNRAMIHTNEQEMIKDTDKINNLRGRLNSLLEEKLSIDKKIAEYKNTKGQLDAEAKAEFEQREQNKNNKREELISQIQNDIENTRNEDEYNAA